MNLAAHPVQTVLRTASRLVEPAVLAMMRATILHLMELAASMRAEAAERPDVPVEIFGLLDGAIGMLRALLARMEAQLEPQAACGDAAEMDAAPRRVAAGFRCASAPPDAPRRRFGGLRRIQICATGLGWAAPDTG